MRVIGTIVLLAGIWPLWRALTGHEFLAVGAVFMVLASPSWPAVAGVGPSAWEKELLPDCA